jgi:hypothetical protein
MGVTRPNLEECCEHNLSDFAQNRPQLLLNLLFLLPLEFLGGFLGFEFFRCAGCEQELVVQSFNLVVEI